VAAGGEVAGVDGVADGELHGFRVVELELDKSRIQNLGKFGMHDVM